jgi:hypothetical protein
MTPFRAATTTLLLLCSMTAAVTAEAAAKAQADATVDAAAASNDTVVATVTSIAPEKKRVKAMMSKEKEQMKKLMMDKGKMLDQEEERVPLSADEAKKLRRDLQLGAAGGGHGQHHHRHHQAPPYPSPQYIKQQKPQKGKKANGDTIDFSNAVLDPETGKLCVTRFEQFDTLDKDPILECFHRQVKQCHLTYITQYQPNQEEVCEENFEKTCQITFRKQAYNETVRKCYRPLERFCGEEQQYPQPLYSNNGNAVDHDNGDDADEDSEENCRYSRTSCCYGHGNKGVLRIF